MGLLSARPRAQPRPIAGTRTAWRASATTADLCFALALWNGRDPILKERLFGLTGPEGNHGEDVKELYYYLDATPTHSYMKYPLQVSAGGVPVRRPGRDENRRRGTDEPEYELLDTGVFDDERYFDVFVEYAKAAPDDMLIRITAHNRGPEPATLHLLPQLWFRNTWGWGRRATAEPRSADADAAGAGRAARATHPTLGRPICLYAGGEPRAAVHR